MLRRLLKRIYASIPGKPWFFHLLRRLVNLPPHITQHFHFVGVMKVPVDSQRSFKLNHYGFQLENEIFWHGLYGHWEKKSLQLWTSLVRESQVVLDVGANTGVYSLLSKALNPDCQVYAFEPTAVVYERLVENCALNRYNIRCERLALSNFDGEASIFVEEMGNDGHTYCVTVNQNLNKPEVPVSEQRIQTARLQTYAATHQLSKIDLVKLDVETHEPEVLEGFGPILERDRPSLLIEILDDQVAARLEKLLAGHGYLYFDIDDISGSVRQKSALSKSSYWNYLICQPEVAQRIGLIPSREAASNQPF